MNYSARIEGQWNQVIRYDTHHGRLHVHRYWRPKGNQIEYLEKEGSQCKDYGHTYQQIKEDLKENWRRYRHLYEEHLE